MSEQGLSEHSRGEMTRKQDRKWPPISWRDAPKKRDSRKLLSRTAFYAILEEYQVEWPGEPVGGSEVFWEWNGRGHCSIWRGVCIAAAAVVSGSPLSSLPLKRPGSASSAAPEDLLGTSTSKLAAASKQPEEPCPQGAEWRVSSSGTRRVKPPVSLACSTSWH
jgi:hypothetical protein